MCIANMLYTSPLDYGPTFAAGSVDARAIGVGEPLFREVEIK